MLPPSRRELSGAEERHRSPFPKNRTCDFHRIRLPPFEGPDSAPCIYFPLTQEIRLYSDRRLWICAYIDVLVCFCHVFPAIVR